MEVHRINHAQPQSGAIVNLATRDSIMSSIKCWSRLVRALSLVAAVVYPWSLEQEQSNLQSLIVGIVVNLGNLKIAAIPS